MVSEQFHYITSREEIFNFSKKVWRKEIVVLKVYTLEQERDWNAIVRSFDKYDIYWLNGYVKAFYLHGDGEPLLFYYEGNSTRGINVVMKRDISKDKHFNGEIKAGKYFDFTTPYGYGGWIIEGKNVEDLFNSYIRWIETNGVISEFVRFHPIVKNHGVCYSFYDIVQLGEVVHMDLSSTEEIWNNITSKNRNMIRKAIKNGVKIYSGRFPEIYKRFRVIYNSTMDKDNAEKYYYFNENFYTSILEDLPQNAQIFFAEKEENIIAASIILLANGYMNYHLSGSLKEYSTLAVTNLLLYEVALWGNANGYKTLYLGGGVGAGEDGLFKFKRSFYRGNLNHFFIGKKIYNKEKYDKLLLLRIKDNGKVEQSKFFPQYRG